MLKTIKIKNGYIRGIAAADPRITAFKGIPFAAPPVGDLRWNKPLPCQDWEGVLDCLEFGPIPMQSIPGLDKESIYTKEWNVDSKIPMSEDCLTLNVWTPAKEPDEKLPVYLWFYGGALQWGNAAEMEFDGERIARRGIVVVTISYRLNIFGFFAHPDVPFNLGNCDQQHALKWVWNNIGAFGGDRERITIGGQSAGGGSVMTQLNCEENRNYIKGAIVESGVFAEPFQSMLHMSKEDAVQQSLEFFDFLGVKTLDEARKLSAEYIRDRNDELGKRWVTIVDGGFQTDTPINNIRKGKFLDVPLFLGWTNHEFMLEDRGVSAIEIGSREVCEELEKVGYRSSQFVYEFAADIPGEDKPGAFHSSDLWFFFETLAKCWRPFIGKDYDLARHMCNYWCNFIKSGDPNGSDSDGRAMPLWRNYQVSEGNIMKFEDEPLGSEK